MGAGAGGGPHGACAAWTTRRGCRLALLLALLLFILTPATKSWVRVQEYEADIFGLNAARRPDGMAAVSLALGDYRKLDPGRLEEIVFFDHPSGRTRIFAAMRWKAEHLAE